MRALTYCLVLTIMAACGPADSTSAGASKLTTDVSNEAEELVKQASKGASTSMDVSEEACVMLEDGVVPELFGVDPSQITYQRSIPVKRAGHVVCSAGWDYPDKAELEAAYTQSVQQWGRDMATGKKEPMPQMPSLAASVSITLMATRYDSVEAAVAGLEGSVNSLQKGVTVTVGGKDYTTQEDFGDWIDNVGDKAIFTAKGELLVAYNGSRFSVNVAVSDDPAVDQDQTLLLAGRIMQSL